MLESLVSSRIRRTLLEHILHHPQGRFYLRGLAKELALTVSPVRRELKRLEELGMLKAYQEANIRFYVVDQTSPVFVQLRQAVMPVDETLRAEAALMPASAPVEPPPVAPVRPEPVIASTVITPKAIERLRRVSPPAPRWLAVAGVLSFGMTAVALVLAAYIATVRERPLRETRHQPQSQQPAVIQMRMEPVTPSVTGQMQGRRWKLMPGAVGGFSAGGGAER